MNSHQDPRGTTFDTSQPGIRHIQDLIRRGENVNVLLCTGQQLNGILRWQDHAHLALRTADDQPLTLINRTAVVLIGPVV